MLTLKGAGVQFFLGWLLFALGGWQWTVPILVFFLTSSLLTAFASRRRGGVKSLFASHDIRDAPQVLANGGTTGLFVVLWYCTGSELFYIASLGGIASVAADTWGTEIGVTSRSAPRLIITWNPVNPGRSGAISLRGVIAGIIGAGVVAVSAVPWLETEGLGMALASLALAGSLGSVVDSYLGATIQVQYVCSTCGILTEREAHCGGVARRSHGVRWFGNNLVNLACSLSGSAVAVALYLLLLIQ
jgi:uncharacterized protein (TIGR00297 family)